VTALPGLVSPVRWKLRAALALAWLLSLALVAAWGLWQQSRAERAHADAMAQAAETARLREEALHGALIEQTRRLRAAEEVNRVASNNLAVARRDAAAADAARAGVLDHVAELEARAAAGDSCTAADRQAAGAAARMLADLQRRADERAGILAAYADDPGCIRRRSPNRRRGLRAGLRLPEGTDAMKTIRNTLASWLERLAAWVRPENETSGGGGGGGPQPVK